jgi:hypothetical protein
MVWVSVRVRVRVGVRVRFCDLGDTVMEIRPNLQLILHASTFVKQKRYGNPMYVRHHPPMYVGH